MRRINMAQQTLNPEKKKFNPSQDSPYKFRKGQEGVSPGF